MVEDGRFGKCTKCGADLQAVYFREKEMINHQETGRVRIAVDYLICPICLETECVDDSLDGDWFRPHR